MFQNAKLISLLFLAALFVVSACNKGQKRLEEQALEDDIIMQEYVQNQGLNAEILEVDAFHKIYYTMQVQGSGDNPTLSNSVTVHYRGLFLDGSEFDSSYSSPSGNPVTFPLTNVIRGWQEGIPLFKRGGKGTLIIPSGLAYGPAGQSEIGPNEVLRFDIELFDFD